MINRVRTYYTLEDMINHQIQWRWELDLGQIPTVTGGTYFKSLAESFVEYSIQTPTLIGSERANELFCRYIVPRYKNLNVCYIDGYPIDDDDLTKAYKDFMLKYISILNSTYERYTKLLDIYDAEKSALMEGVEVTSENKFNDTPQNQQGIYSWDTDTHLSSVTRNTTNSQLTTKINRIAEIDRELDNYFDKWAKEFRGMFFYE